MPILPRSGRVVIAESILLRTIHVAWGLGDGDWIDPPSENPDAIALQNEIGRRLANDAAFVVPDAAGSIVLPTGKFSPSASPTNSLLVSVTFDFADAPGEEIREFGVFVGTEVVAGLPTGQRYFTPAQVSNPGRLLHIENTQPIYRSPAIRESFQIVVTF